MTEEFDRDQQNPAPQSEYEPHEEAQAAPAQQPAAPQEPSQIPQAPQIPQQPQQQPYYGQPRFDPYQGQRYSAPYGYARQPYTAGGYQQPRQQPPQPPQQPKKKVWGVVLAVSLVWVAVIALIVYFSVFFRAGETVTPVDRTEEPGKTEPAKTEERDFPSPQIDRTSGYTGEAMAGAKIYENNVDCVVFVTAKKTNSTSLGSGFVIDAANGYILTNNHVIDGATEVTVTLKDEEEYAAEIVGGDEVNDIAVLRVKAQGLKQVTIGDSDNLKVGNDLYIIGHALGTLVDSCTKGIVSGLNRDLAAENEYVITVFQTDAAINGGNSGGPAFDPSGAVVGIASSKYAATGVEALCFCIPINDAMEVAEDLIAYGYVKGRANFGVAVSTSSGYTVSYDIYGRRTIRESMKGAVIEQIASGSAAEKAGLKVGDIVTKLNDIEITTAMELINAKNKYKAGDTVTLTVYRDGEILTLELTLDEYIPDK